MTEATMHAIRVHHYGGPEVLKVELVPRPTPQEGEVLVRVHAAGVLPMETYIRRGYFPGVHPKSFPYTPGSAFAGVVEEVGPGVKSWQRGDAICGRSPHGTYAEYTVTTTNPPTLAANPIGHQVSAAVVPLAPKPKTLTFDEAATLSGGATTAWTSIFEDGNVQPGQRVLIHAAAGGVGLFAVQFAKWKGAQVTGTASAANLDFVHSLGAETVIDYNRTPFDDVAKEVDFVLDTIGGDTMLRSMKILKRGGTLVSIVDTPPADLAAELGVRASKNAVLPTSAHLRTIVQLIDEGHAKPAIRQIFSLQEAPAAHALCETGHGRGRIVLHIAD
jgi:NADPH:quinone reductase-like Zn-dependent oxidoreductase